MCNTCYAYEAIGSENAGYVITDMIESPDGELFATGYRAASDEAVTWAAKVQNGRFCYFWGHYFSYFSSYRKSAHLRAQADMFNRAGYGKD